MSHPFSLFLSHLLHYYTLLLPILFKPRLPPSWQLGFAASSYGSPTVGPPIDFSIFCLPFFSVHSSRPNEITMRQGPSNQLTPWHGCQGIWPHTWPGTPIRSRTACRNASRIHGYCLVFVPFSSRMMRFATPTALPKRLGNGLMELRMNSTPYIEPYQPS